MLNNGKILKYGTPKDIKSEMHNEIIEIVCPEIRKAFEVVKSETQFEVQMFGDRIDIAVNSYEKDIDTIKNLFKSHSIPVEDYRLKPVSLENVFIKILKEIAV
jgi:ABC-type multidrug transport system ATPase subunit